MACVHLKTICIVLISLVANMDCSPMKRSIAQEAADQLPENIQQIIMSAVPNINDVQTRTLVLMENVTKNVDTMATLLGNVANLLQSQLNILNQRLPPVPVETKAPTALPTDCQDVAAQGPSASGPYTIEPQDDLGPLTVYCDMDTDGGGWTVFQKRFDGTVDFYLGWDQYENGFGSPDGEFWAGLQNIHRLSQTGEWTLRIELEDFQGNQVFAKYDSFSLGDAASFYQLSIGAYSGNAGDSLSYHNNEAFTTKDADHDRSDRNQGNCAVTHIGAWWYGDCQNSNLNGQWLGPDIGTNKGIVWYDWKGATVLKRSEMKMRRVL